MDIVFLRNNNKYYENDYNKEDEFEKTIFTNYKMFFGQNTLLIDVKKKIESKFLGGVIPDGFLIDLKDIDNPEFYLVEVELSKHDFFNHIFPQITKFFAFFKNSENQNDLLNKLYNIITSDGDLKKSVIHYIGNREIFKFLKDMIENSQNVLLIMDKEKSEISEIVNTYTDTWGKIVKIAIVKKYVCNEDLIYLVSPDFEYIKNIEDVNDKIIYTEEYHLEGVSEDIKYIYKYFKDNLYQKDPDIKFNPQKYYISLKIKKNFAYFEISKKKIRMSVMQSEEILKSQIKFHPIKNVPLPSRKFYFGVDNPASVIMITDKNNLEEILNVLLEIKK